MPRGLSPSADSSGLDAFESLSRAAGPTRYTGPERLAGRLAPSVPDDGAVEALPRGSFGLSSVARPAYRDDGFVAAPPPPAHAVQCPDGTADCSRDASETTGVSSVVVIAYPREASSIPRANTS